MTRAARYIGTVAGMELFHATSGSAIYRRFPGVTRAESLTRGLYALVNDCALFRLGPQDTRDWPADALDAAPARVQRVVAALAGRDGRDGRDTRDTQAGGADC